MFKYRFTRKDMKTLRDWIHCNIDPDIRVKRGRRFECDIDEEIIFIKNKKYCKLDTFFSTWYKRQEFYTPIHYTLICILHEIGHIMTKDDELLENGYKLNCIYNFMYQQNVLDEEELNDAYFAIPCESLATKWAVEYFKNNRESCCELAEKLGLFNLE